MNEAERRERIRRLRALAGRTPGQAITKETWAALGFDEDGEQARPLTQDPIGAHPHPRPNPTEGSAT